MNKGIIGYWATTSLVAFGFLAGGIMDALAGPDVAEVMSHLGYPLYFARIIGVWKVLGALAIVAPRLPRLKEWAYAGMIFDVTGAAASHLSSGDSIGIALVPLAMGALVVASWYLRPLDRKLPAQSEVVLPAAAEGKLAPSIA